MLAKAMQCHTVEELMALAKSEDIELTREEAEAFMAELVDVELDANTLKNVAGGGFCYTDCRSVCGDYVEFMNG